jgi:hypothetical protein
VHQAYNLYLTSKDLDLALYPATEEELRNIGNIDRSNVFYLQLRMPDWWTSWYYSLTLEEKYRFAKIVEKRLRRQGLI